MHTASARCRRFSGGGCPPSLPPLCRSAPLLSLSDTRFPASRRPLLQVFSVLMPSVLNSHPASAPVLQRLWSVNREVVLRAMVDMHQHDAGSLLLSFNVSTELKARLTGGTACCARPGSAGASQLLVLTVRSRVSDRFFGNPPRLSVPFPPSVRRSSRT